MADDLQTDDNVSNETSIRKKRNEKQEAAVSLRVDVEW